jgi:hypothetical protein
MEANLSDHFGNESKPVLILVFFSSAFTFSTIQSQPGRRISPSSFKTPVSKIDEEALILDLRNKDVTRADGRKT